MLGRTKHKLKFRKTSKTSKKAGEVTLVIDKYTTLQYLKMTGKMAKLTLLSFWRRHRLASRITAFVLFLIMLFAIFYDTYQPKKIVDTYDITGSIGTLLDDPIPLYADRLVLDEKSGIYSFNQDYIPGIDMAGDSYTPKITASFQPAPANSVTVNDPLNKVGLTLKPKFSLRAPQKNENRVLYPIVGKPALKVYTLKGTGVKEDIIFREAPRDDEVVFEYEIELPDGLDTRIENDGSIGVYGVEKALLGEIPTSSESDAELLKKAKENGNKTTFLFSVPAPVVLETKTKKSSANARFELEGNLLTLRVTGLKNAKYPLSVDPTVYVETAQKLMRGNNETNIDFDIDNELIQKSQTTGARIDAWQGNLDMSEGIWDTGTAAAGGYVYRAGGRTGVSKPQIVTEQTTTESTEDNSFQMSMPTDRPAGDLYIALMCHDDSTDTVTAPSGWTEYADIGEFAAYYKIGTDAGGGNEASDYTWTISSSEAKAGTIVRVTGFNASDPVAGTPGTGSGSGVPQFPATTPDNDSTLVIRAAGADNDVPSSVGWIPSAHTKIASGTSGGTVDCGFAAASLDSSPASGVSTGAISLNEMNDTWGGASIAINPEGTIPPPQIEDSATTASGGTDTSSFVMDMPASRPAGDLYVALMCHDGTGTPSVPGGWTQLTDQDEFAAYYKIGTDAGGGNEASTYTWGGISEEWAGVIVRVSGFDSSDVLSGTPGTTNTNGTPGTFPATTPDENNTLVIRAIGADNDDPGTGTAWVPNSHTRISSGTSSATTGDCGFAASQMDNAPASGVSTGTVNMGNSWLDDTYGGISFAINADPSGGGSGGESVRATLDWARFNSSTLEIESPNPGEGVCSGWCNDPTYNLPAGRRGHTMFAYNGFLYVIGGVDSAGTRVSSIFVTKLGANGEPQLWHPTDPDQDNWDYWYTGSTLNGGTEKSYLSAVAYNNRMYIVGGQTDASPGGVTTVEMADILPNGLPSSWTTTGMQVLPAGAGTHMHSVQVYNDTMYTIGGFEGVQTSSANLRSAVFYSKLNTDGTMNTWQSTSGFTTARSSFGGTLATIWGAYVYLGGGCSAVNGSGYCTTVSGDMQVASMNADGTLDAWSALGDLDNTRIGSTFIAWQNGLYRLGGCTSQNSSTGICTSTLADVDYGVVNPAGEVSTVNITTPSGSGNCTGGSPQDCDLPPPGDDAGEGGQMLSVSVILNGYLYVIGGCVDYDCNGTSPAGDDYDTSGNISYVSVGSDGSLQAPSACAGTSYGAWCVDNVNKINNTGSNQTDGVASAGVATFNNRIYVVGGLTGNGLSTNIYYNSTNLDGSLSGAWSSVDTTSVGAIDVAYTYTFARANPSSAGTNPGNLFILGGCGTITSGAGCAGSNYVQDVYKCNIQVSGAVSGCTQSGQMQIDSTPGYGSAGDGLGIHSGTVYANYVFLIGGYSQSESDKDDVIYARIDDSNNIVSVTSGLSTGDWIESPNKLSVGRRRGWAFGYNGHIYSVGGYDDSGTGIIPFIEWSKMSVSDGSIDPFVTSSVTINQRWGLSMVVSNSYAYVIGGCDVGASPSSCSSFENSVQTFQLYNNNSGAVNDFSAQADQTFTADTDRWGSSSVVYNGYIYVAGGCVSATDCTDATNSVQYAPISPADGTIGTWAAGGNLPADRAWGSLQEAGGTLYYIGGQDDTATNEQATVYYTTGISSGNPTWSGSAASNGIPAARTKFGAAVWDDRLYVVGGLDGSAAVSSTVYVSPQLSAGGDITNAWSSTGAFDVARTGAAVTAYANNLYLFGGYDGSNYLSDSQFASIGYKTGTISQSGTTITGSGTVFTSGQVGSTIKYLDGSTAIITGYTSGTSLTVNVSKTVDAGTLYVIQDGSISSWSFSTSLPGPLRDSQAVSANGYLYLVGGRSATSTCNPKILITPISANTTIVSGNDPTGTGEWYETNVRYTGDRYGAAISYANGKLYTMGGGCSSPLSSDRHYYSTIKSQPQVARYSRLIDTDSDVFPNSWLLNGLDNSIGARWEVRYRSMNDTDGIATDCGSADMTTWGQDTNFGETTLGRVEVYTPKDASGTDIECARYFYFFVGIDASRTFGYPEDVNRGPTINDLSLFFTSDPNKRLRHGKTFTGGEQQPLDTPCRVGGANPSGSQPNCPLP